MAWNPNGTPIHLAAWAIHFHYFGHQRYWYFMQYFIHQGSFMPGKSGFIHRASSLPPRHACSPLLIKFPVLRHCSTLWRCSAAWCSISPLIGASCLGGGICCTSHVLVAIATCSAAELNVPFPHVVYRDTKLQLYGDRLFICDLWIGQGTRSDLTLRVAVVRRIGPAIKQCAVQMMENCN